MNQTAADFTALAGALLQLEQRLDARALAEVTALAHGRTPGELARALRDVADPAAIRAAAELLAANEGGCACSGEAPPEPDPSQLEEAAGRLAREATAPFVRNPPLAEKLRALGVIA